MSIIADTSIIISVLVNEKHKNEIIRLTKGEEILVPESLHFEIGNAFSAMLKRKKMSLKIALSAIENYLQIPLHFIDVDIKKSLEIAARYNIYAYDAYFIDCCLRYRSELMSLDKGLITAAKKEGIVIREII